MKMFQFVAALQLLLLLVNGSAVVNAEKIVQCYYADGIEKLTDLEPEEIHASPCTHLVYMIFKYENESNSFVPPVNKEMQQTRVEDYLHRIVRLKEKKPELKILALIVRDLQMMQMIRTSSGKRTFINNTVEFVKSSGVDGLEMATPISLPEDGVLFGQFLCELRTEFDKHGYLLTIVTYHMKGVEVDSGIDDMKRCTDHITIATLENKHRNLGGFNIDLMDPYINSYLTHEVPAEKLVILISVPAMIALQENENEAAAEDVMHPPNFNESNYVNVSNINYPKLMKRIHDPSENWTIKWNNNTNTPYAYNNNGWWVSYEDVSTMTIKGQYIMKNGLGGAAIFTIDEDDNVGVNGKRDFPLTRAIHDAFLGRQ